jgi:tetratricopeptide (TPR) repeat protein
VFFYAQTEPLLPEHRYTEAVVILEQAAQLHQDNPEPLLKIGQIYLLQQRWLLAEDAFNRALARDIANAPAAAGLARSLFQQGRLAEAIKWWQKAIDLDTGLPGAFTGLGQTYLLQFDFESARESFLQQQQHAFDPQAAWYLAAMTAPVDLAAGVDYLHDIGEDAPVSVQEQRDYLWAALAPFDKETPAAEVAKATGIALAQIELWPLAVYALSIAAEQRDDLSPTMQAETLAFLSHALAQAGRPALKLFEEAAQLDPNSALPLFFEGIYLRRQGALNAAETSFQHALALDSLNAALYAEMGHTKLAQGDIAAAELWYQTAVQVAEKNPLPFQLLLLNFYANRSYRMEQAGIPLAEEILKSQPNNAEIYDTLGWMQFLSGEADSGEKAFRQALELDPHLTSAHYHLGRYYESTGLLPSARAEYRRAVDEDTTGTYRDLALKALVRLDTQEAEN